MEPAALSAIGSTGGSWGGPWPYWRVEVDAKPSKFWPTDDASIHYQNVSGEEKEGADLICQAEALLSKDASHEQALGIAEKAVAFFKKLADGKGTADAIRVAVHAHRARCHSTVYVKSFGYKHKIRDALRDAQLLAETELEVFREQGDKRGEGAMELSLAEIAFEGDKVLEAIDRAQMAITKFHEASDWRMEAVAMLALSNMHFRGAKSSEALEWADKAAAIYKKLGDDRGLAKSLHATALAHALNLDLKAAVQKAMEAVAIFRDLQMSKLEAVELLTIAKWQLASERSREALPAAKEALALFEEMASPQEDGAQEVHCGKGWLASALRAVVEAYLARDETGNALRAANSTLERCQGEDRKKDVKTLTLIQDALARVHLARNELVQAVQMCDAAWAGAQDDARDQEVTSLVLQTWAKVSFRLGGNILEAIGNYFMAGDAAGTAQNVFLQASCYLELFEDCMAERDPKRAQEAAGLLKSAFEKRLADNAASGTQSTWSLGVAAGKLLFARAFTLIANWDMAQQEVDTVPFDDDMSASWKATVWRHKAEILEGRLQIPEAVEAYKKAQVFFQEAELMKSWASVTLSMATLLHTHQKESSEAFTLALKAQEQFKKTVDPLGELRALLLVFQAAIQVCANAGAPSVSVVEQAWKLLKEAGRLSKKYGDKATDGAIAYYHAQLALVHGRGNATEAMTVANDALAIFKEIDDLASQGYVKLFIAQIYSLKGNQETRKAIDAARDAFNLFTQCGSEEGSAQAIDDLQNLGVNFSSLGFMMPNMGAGMAGMMGGMMGGGMPMMGGGTASKPEAVKDAPSKDKPAQESSLVVKLSHADVESKIRSMLMDVLANDDEEVDPDADFADAGMDSLNAVNFRNDLSASFDVPLGATVLFDYPSINKMASHVHEELEKAGLAK